MKTEQDQIIDHLNWIAKFWDWYEGVRGQMDPQYLLPNPEPWYGVRIEMFHHEVDVTLN